MKENVLKKRSDRIERFNTRYDRIPPAMEPEPEDKEKEVDEVQLFYTAFVSPLVQTPESAKLLPISNIGTGTGEDLGLINYDPSTRDIPRTVAHWPYCSAGMVIPHSSSAFRAMLRTCRLSP